MKRVVWSAAIALLVSAMLWQVEAGAPVKVSGIIDVKSAVTEAKAKVEKLDASVADEETFAKAVKEKVVAQDAGVLACLAQAITEHEKGKATGIAGPALRDAALVLVKAKKLADAQAALKTVHAALKGEGKGETEHAWNKLINMHRMMEEMNYRTSRLRRSLKRPRKIEADAGHATVLTVMALAMEADTHEVKKKEEIPIWNKMSREYSTGMSKLAKAMLDKKADVAKEIFNASANSCKQCHEKFRD